MNSIKGIIKKQTKSGDMGMSVRAKIGFTIILIAIVVVIIGIASGIIFTKDNLERTIEGDMVVVGQIADNLVSTEINLLKADGAMIAHYLAKTEPEDLHMIMEEELANYSNFIALSVLDKNGDIDSVGSSPTPANLAGSEYAKRAFEGESVISSTSKDDHGNLVIYVYVPMTDERILSVTIDGYYFRNLLQNYRIWETGHIFIDDADGTIIANPRKNWVSERYNFMELAKDNEKEYGEIAATVSKMTKGESGIGRFSIGGESRICAYMPITASKVGWSLGVVAPTAESPANRVTDGLLIVGLICIILSAVAALFASKIVEKPFVKIRNQERLLNTINGATAMLLGAEEDDFENAIHRCLGMIGQGVGVDRMRIWKNTRIDGELYCSQLYEWSEFAEPQDGRDIVKDVSYYGTLPGWEDTLASGKIISGSVSDFTEVEQSQLLPQDILAILVVPIFYQDEFWGFLALDDCHSARTFTAEEADIIRSGGLLFSNAMLQNALMIDLVKAREDAVAGAEAKSDFLANMSHEMRTPLNAIIGLSELTLDAGGLGSEAYGNLERVYNSGMTLLSLINDILDISKIESGKFELVDGDYDLPSLINDTTTLNIVRIGSKPIEFTLNIDENLPSRLIGDELRLKQIFNNLLSNAFKYTQEGSVEWNISYEEKDGDGWLVSSVTDTGMGIRQEDVQKLFLDYSQLDSKRNRKIEGSGLGLAITKQLVQLMDGEISVESEYGKGSRFTVRIKQTVASDVPIGSEVVKNLRSFRYTVQKRDRSSKMVRAFIPYARVLVVDDVQTNLDVARGMMNPYGMTVDCASNGPAAIELVRNGKEKYNAIFMDHMMPGMDGIEAVKIIREEIGTDYAKTVPIIALTANAILGNEEMFLNNGFQAFIPKPIDIMRLDAAINQWVRDKNQEKSHGQSSEHFSGHVRYGLDHRSGIERRRVGNRRTGHDRRGGLQVAPKGAKPITGKLSSIVGLDLHAGVARFDDNETAYLEVLKSFLTNTPSLLQDMKNYIEDGEARLQDYAIVVHGIKSSSRSIGAMEVGARAESLEHAAKSGDMQFVLKNNEPFAENLNSLIAAINAALPKTDEYDHLRPEKYTPDEEVLDQIREACQLYDTDLVEEALRKLEKYQYKVGADLVTWLREQADLFAFKKIAERLKED
ncbi:MAG: response regulator [Clostridiales Family XIII bacterium]|jgi:signal transduction histidine kinase/CheY-like chemotaxis protein/HPt (histidine-containing phosphotransfer) domain-containing protein|nr:response regulator [Clostridiales Family XIII bacterium]